jgi:hypothetical protein
VIFHPLPRQSIIKPIQIYFRISKPGSRVMDPHNFDADPDFYLMQMRIRIRLFTLMRIRIQIQILASNYRSKFLKKCSNRLIFHRYILAWHLQIDADLDPVPVPAYTFMRIRILILV